MITLFGATGYTGRLVARALARQEHPFRLAGRSPDKLAALSEMLPTSPAFLVADATRPDTLSALFRDTRVLINCVGPFTDLGEPVVAQAGLSGVHYLDTTNELGYVYRMQSYDQLARQHGAAVVPACGFEVALSDCAAAMLSRLASARGENDAPFDAVSVVYALSGWRASIGTRRSAVRALATSWLGYRGGRWVGAIPGGQAHRFRLDEPLGLRLALSFPSAETVTLPQHIKVDQVMTWMVFPWPIVLLGPVAVPAFAWLARGPVGALIMAAISRIAAPPDAGMRDQAPFQVRVTLRQGDRSWSLAMSGQGVYDLTANIIAYAAGELCRPDYDRSGVLAPAQALDPRGLLDFAGGEWTVEEGGRRV